LQYIAYLYYDIINPYCLLATQVNKKQAKTSFTITKKSGPSRKAFLITYIFIA